MTWPLNAREAEAQRSSGAEVNTPTYAGVRVDHPDIVALIKNCARQRREKEEAQKLSGMPYEVVDRYYQEVAREK